MRTQKHNLAVAGRLRPVAHADDRIGLEPEKPARPLVIGADLKHPRAAVVGVGPRLGSKHRLLGAELPDADRPARRQRSSEVPGKLSGGGPALAHVKFTAGLDGQHLAGPHDGQRLALGVCGADLAPVNLDVGRPSGLAERDEAALTQGREQNLSGGQPERRPVRAGRMFAAAAPCWSRTSSPPAATCTTVSPTSDTWIHPDRPGQWSTRTRAWRQPHSPEAAHRWGAAPRRGVRTVTLPCAAMSRVRASDDFGHAHQPTPPRPAASPPAASLNIRRRETPLARAALDAIGTGGDRSGIASSGVDSIGTPANRSAAATACSMNWWNASRACGVFQQAAFESGHVIGRERAVPVAHELLEQLQVIGFGRRHDGTSRKFSRPLQLFLHAVAQSAMDATQFLIDRRGRPAHAIGDGRRGEPIRVLQLQEIARGLIRAARDTGEAPRRDRNWPRPRDRSTATPSNRAPHRAGTAAAGSGQRPPRGAAARNDHAST